MIDTAKLRYTETHEWVSLNGNIATVGITDHAQKEISDVVFVELPAVGKSVKKKDSVMVVESVKAAFDIYAPMTGKILKANTDLSVHPEFINSSPLEKGWLYQMECSSAEEFNSLLDEAAYHAIQH